MQKHFGRAKAPQWCTRARVFCPIHGRQDHACVHTNLYVYANAKEGQSAPPPLVTSHVAALMAPPPHDPTLFLLGVLVALALLLLLLLSVACAAVARKKGSNETRCLAADALGEPLSQQRQPAGRLWAGQALQSWAAGPWVVVGSGLTAAACVLALPGPVADLVSVREASSGMGGRAVTVPSPAALPSTSAAPLDLGAWVFQPLLHPAVTTFMDAVRMSSVDVDLFVPGETFVFDAVLGQRRPFGTLPPTTAQDSLWAVGAKDPLLWFAHTGLWPSDAPTASAQAVAGWDLPRFGRVPTAFGWQGAVLRALGPVPALTDCLLQAVHVDHGRPSTTGASTAPSLTLQYTNGTQESGVAVAVLTMGAAQLGDLQGLPATVPRLVRDSFVSVPAGVLYATWSSVDVWWPRQGWTKGTVVSSLPIGRVTVVGTNDLRAAMSGAPHVTFWNNLFGAQDTTAARTEIARQLAQTFGLQGAGAGVSAGSQNPDPPPLVPLPATVTWKPWPKGTTLWRVGVNRQAVRRRLARPFGPHVPVFWASADADPAWGGWAQGAIAQGTQAAVDAVQFATAV